MDWKIKKAQKGLKGELRVPPDKSISHRAVMFSSIARGKCRIDNFLFGEDCMRTYEAFLAMGVSITRKHNAVVVKGDGLKGLKAPAGALYMGNSGTSMRIMSGILAGQDFATELTGDESLSKRPMGRIVEPLRSMGANIETAGDGRPPIKIAPAGGPLKAVTYNTPVASAQVKSCVLSAGLYADGTTALTEPFQSRNHTEKMLEYFSAEIEREGLTTRVTGGKELVPKDLSVPGDVSSAAFFIVGALLVEGSNLVLRGVGLNPTRTGLISVLKRMGAKIDILDLRGESEPSGDLRALYSPLEGTIVKPSEIPLLIDEIPVLIIAAVTASSPTEIQGISELRVKESDRVRSMTENLSKLGVEMMEKGDSLIIYGGKKTFTSAVLDSFGDHRIAMSMAVASLISDDGCTIRDTDCVNTSYPDFPGHLAKVS